jgi:DNA-binding NtrC family response regulator
MSEPGNILVVDDDASLRTMLAELLRSEGHTVTEAEDGARALAAAGRDAVDLTLLDLRLPDGSGLDLLPKLKELRPESSVIMLTALGSIRDAVEAMRLGADNFVPKPIDPEGLFTIVGKGLDAALLRRRAARMERLSPRGEAALFGDSPEMREALRLVDAVASRDTTVLIQGETGTGKGVLARRVHDLSPRRGEPFVELNCAGLSRELTESELFGHERGAFTGAVERKLGLFEAAGGGSLFLDEVGELEPSVQAKLLKVLESRRFRRVGGVAEIRSDVRLIAATHRDLVEDAKSGRFRADLFYRLNVFAIPLPPLRARRRDVLPLAIHFFLTSREQPEAEEPDVQPAAILSDAAARALEAYDWPGNVRELKNVMERAAILCPRGSMVLPSHLPPLGAATSGPPAAADPATRNSFANAVEDAERQAIAAALQRNDGSIRGAARELRLARSTFYRKARQFGLIPEGTGE